MYPSSSYNKPCIKLLKLSLPALFAAASEYLELGGLAVVVEHLPLRQPHLVLMMNININIIISIKIIIFITVIVIIT